MKLEIEADSKSIYGKVVLDGKDISSITSGVTVVLDVDEPTKAVIRLMPQTIRYEGDVEVLEYVGINGRPLVEDTKR